MPVESRARDGRGRGPGAPHQQADARAARIAPAQGPRLRHPADQHGDPSSRRPVDLLPDREAATLARWLTEHPGVEVICRDRAPAYAEGARLGAPNAVQVADRWHLFHNLTEAVERCVTRHSRQLREPDHVPTPEESAAALAKLEKITQAAKTGRGAHRYADRTRELHQAIHALLDQGLSRREISRRLDLARGTVRRFAHAGIPEELVVGKWQGRTSVLDDYKPYLHQRWQEGCTTAKTLFEEIKATGNTGGLTVLRDYLRPLRSGAEPQAAPPGRDQLVDWIGNVKSTDLPELVSFVNGIGSDLGAVVAGLSLPFSSGVVEGQVNRIKMVKRQMFGRAGLDLLRKRVLLAA
ncbi:transposase [Kitasatospora sp. NPDC091335]|uniref:transposase n=1 Tax=Kitasatospora sp. NPDC091335 TaxID=3364085 RepID=UPI0038178D68